MDRSVAAEMAELRTPTEAVHGGQTLWLTSPLQEQGITLFRQTLTLHLALDPQATRLGLTADSLLKLHFLPHDLTINASNSEWIKNWKNQGDEVEVTLRYPAPISQIDNALYATVALHRVDGKAVSEQATLTATTGSALSQPFSGASFKAKFSDLNEIRLHEKTVSYTQEKQHRALSAQVSAQAGGGLIQQAEVRQQWQQTIQAVLIQSGQMALKLQGRPTNPRLRLLDRDGEELLWQWLEPGEHNSAILFDGGDSGIADAWQSAFDHLLTKLDQQLAEQAQPRPAEIELTLLVESDGPCRVVVNALLLSQTLAQPLAVEPASLLFTGSGEQCFSWSIALPAKPLNLQIEANLAAKSAATAGLPALESLDKQLGIRLSAGEQLASPWEISAPMQLTGTAITWHPLADHCRLRFTLHNHSNGQPAPGRLAEVLVDSTASAAGWLLARWPTLALQSGHYWLRINVEQGEGLWLADKASAPLQLWRTLKGGKPEAMTPPIQPCIQPLSGADATVPPIEIMLDQQPFALQLQSPEHFTATLAPWPPGLHDSALLSVRSSNALSLTLKKLTLTYRID